MLGTVDEIMNRELVTVEKGCVASNARAIARKFEIAALPVVDALRRPIGMMSFDGVPDRDGCGDSVTIKPALSLPTGTSIREAAGLLAATNRHHVVIIDEHGAAVGIVSSLDLLRAAFDLPARHPPAFPHWDEATQVSWTDDQILDEEGCRSVPKGPGVLVLIRAHVHEPNEVVWAEDCFDLPARVRELVSRRYHPEPELWRHLAQSRLRFRAAPLSDPSARRRVTDHFRSHLARSLPPGARS